MDIAETVRTWQEYLEQFPEIHDPGRKSFVVPFFDEVAGKGLSSFSLELAEALCDEPDETLKAAEIAVEQILDHKKLKIRVKKLPDSLKIRIRDLRAEHLGKLIVIEGVIRQTSDVRPKVTYARFECPNCGNIIPVLQLEQAFKEPTRCGCGRKGKFRLKEKEMVDCQRLKVEESIDSLEGNEQPRLLNVLLKDDLTCPDIDKRNTPGTKIRLTGVIADVPVTLRTGGTSTDRDVMMEAIYLEPLEEDFYEVKVTPEEEKQIMELSKSEFLFDELIDSYAPDIEGYREIKLSIVLQLFSGVKKLDKDGKISRRGDFHILLVGDPGAGKTKLIKYAEKIAPKHRYSAGGGSSGKGLTASVDRDEFIGGWAVQAGTLVLANKGVAIIDEFDKLSEEDRALMHEALSEQTVSVDKATVHATLKAETSVLAAANPKFSRFDPHDTLGEQIDLPASLINRFDLIFPIKDIPDKQHDSDVIDKILQVHTGSDSINPSITPLIFKKYISYAKQNFNPTLSKEAQEEIKKIYLDMRNAAKKTSAEKTMAVPITARQAEGVIRVAEASARARLSTIVSKKDVKRAEEVMLFCLRQIALDPETGTFDIDRIESKITQSTRDKINIILDTLKEIEYATQNQPVTVEELIVKCKDKGVSEEQVEKILEKLSHNGEVFCPKPGVYKVIS